MATQTIEFRSPPLQTITAKLFAVGSDTQVDSVSTTEATNRKGTYSAAYTDVPAGEYELIALVSTTPVARWFVTLTLTTATFQVYDKSQTVLMVADVMNASALAADAVAEIQSGLATPTNITAGTLTTVTNLTNAPTAGDLTAAMIASVTAAVPTVVSIQSGLATPTNITAASGITVSSIGANVVTASALAADAVAEIQSGLATPTNITAGTITTTTNLTNAPTSGDLTAAMIASVTAAVPTVASIQSGLATPTNITAATGIAVSSIGANVVTAAALAADAVAEIQSGLATPTNITAGTLTTVTNLTNAATAGDLTAAMQASVNAEVLDVLNVDTFAELAAPPAATSSLRDKLTWLSMWARNKSTQTSTERKLFADDTTTIVGTETVGDSAGVFTKGEAS